MDWNEIGAVGEILGTASVIITFAYLAIEMDTVNHWLTSKHDCR